MAKDKSKKKGGKPAADNDEFGKPSDAPAGGDGWKLADDDTRGKLMLFTPLREEEVPAYGKAGQNGEKQMIVVADVVVLNEKKPEKSEEHEEVYVFQRYVQGALRGYIGERRVLGRLQYTEDTTKAKSQSGGYYWELEDADADDIKVARAYLESLDPFAQKGGKKGGKKGKGDDDSSGKKSKGKAEKSGKKKSKK